MKNLQEYVKYDNTGDVDIEATMTELRTAVEAFATLQKSDLESVGAGVNAVFDQFRGSALNMPALISFTLHHLGTGPKEHKVVGERIANYVRNNKAAFSIGKGRSGGVRRLADAPATPVAAE